MDRNVAPLGNNILIPSQPALLLIAAYRGLNSRFTTLEASMITITTPLRFVSTLISNLILDMSKQTADCYL
jgi:hypothetical protein